MTNTVQQRSGKTAAPKHMVQAISFKGRKEMFLYRRTQHVLFIVELRRTYGKEPLI